MIIETANGELDLEPGDEVLVRMIVRDVMPYIPSVAVSTVTTGLPLARIHATFIEEKV